jgi:hypothetical protein
LTAQQSAGGEKWNKGFPNRPCKECQPGAAIALADTDISWSNALPSGFVWRPCPEPAVPSLVRDMVGFHYVNWISIRFFHPAFRGRYGPYFGLVSKMQFARVWRPVQPSGIFNFRIQFAAGITQRRQAGIVQFAIGNRRLAWFWMKNFRHSNCRLSDGEMEPNSDKNAGELIRS